MSRSANYPKYLAIARKRITNVLRDRLVAHQHMLESKIAEAGPPQMRVPPHIIGAAVRSLLFAGSVYAVATRPATFYALVGSDEKAVSAEYKRRAALERKFAKHAMKSGKKPNIGTIAEEILGAAFNASPHFTSIQPWGDVSSYNGIQLSNKADGLVQLRRLPPGATPQDGIALVEVKNKRGWLYAEGFEVWKLIRSAYTIDATPIIFARRIHGTGFRYVFRKLGALGAETFKQFVPAALESELADVKHKNGLGYHDLDFSETFPDYLLNSIERLSSQVIATHNRAREVRPIVEPYLDELAQEKLQQKPRRRKFLELLAEIRRLDADDDESNDLDDAENGAEEDETPNSEDYRQEMRDAVDRDYWD